MTDPAESKTNAPKPLGVRATPDQRRILKEAAGREHRSVSSFVLQAALTAAQMDRPLQRRSPDEVRSILDAFRKEVHAANPTGRDLVAELIAERRAEAARE